MHADHDLFAAAVVEGEVEDLSAFFAPSSTDMVDGLVAEYRRDRQRVADVAAFAAGEVCSGVLSFFLSGNASSDRGRFALESSAEQLFAESGAVAALNSAYWSRALNLTDVYNAMPQKRRDEWNAVIREQKAPDFDEEAVRSTLTDLLNSRAKFLAERVDGIFRALSGTHVTNAPEAFGRRMIIANLVGCYGSTNVERVGYINDLRCVIAKFMGRGEPQWNATSGVVTYARQSMRGQWVTVDGGALRIRAYKCGTAHLEVHPDMAWRLNCVLAHMYPTAIPAKFRQRPTAKPKDFVMRGRPLPFDVLDVLASLEPAVRVEKNPDKTQWRREYLHTQIPNALQFRYGGAGGGNPQAVEEAKRVLAYLGAVQVGHIFQFDYHAGPAVMSVVHSGCLPDQRAHQYYPTPDAIAVAAVEAAQIGPEHMCMEPSSGTGALAVLMPRERTLCVEISGIHCAVLRAKGFEVVEADFLGCSVESVGRHDRIVMNPPFSDGRAQRHAEHAFSLLKPGGRLVAVLPASMRGKDFLPGVTEWSRVYQNEFAGTSVSVVLMVVQK
jgi:hypothetical protein